MKSMLTELDNNEAVLLMYLSGELPEGDRAEVEQMLHDDDSLRDELARFRDELKAIDTVLRTDDGLQALSRHAAAARRVTREIGRWNTERVVRPARQDTKSFRLPAWIYPVAAAASVAIVFFLWWSEQPDSLDIVVQSGTRMTDPLSTPTIESRPADGRYATADNSGMDDISRIERQLDAVAELREMIR